MKIKVSEKASYSIYVFTNEIIVTYFNSESVLSLTVFVKVMLKEKQIFFLNTNFELGTVAAIF